MDSKELDAQHLSSAIRSVWPQACSLDLHDELPSTNLHLTDKIQKEKNLPTTLCVAQKQTEGMGRRGKRWHSPEGSVTFSIAHKFSQPAATLMGLSLVTGIAVTDVLNELVPANYALKWPNDILVQHKKLAGLLIDIPQSDKTGTWTVTGIGINYHNGAALQKVDQPFALLSELTDRLPSKDHLIGSIASRVLNYYARFAETGWTEFAERWKTRDYLLGKPVEISGAQQPVTGIAAGVAPDGGLLVQHGANKKTYYSGEVSVRATD